MFGTRRRALLCKMMKLWVCNLEKEQFARLSASVSGRLFLFAGTGVVVLIGLLCAPYLLLPSSFLGELWHHGGDYQDRHEGFRCGGFADYLSAQEEGLRVGPREWYFGRQRKCSYQQGKSQRGKRSSQQ